MRYLYKCNEINCKNRNKEVIINKPVEKAGEPEYCEECKKELQRIYGGSVKPAGDKQKF